MMKTILVIATIAVLTACNSEVSYKKATDAQDAGREFIRASLDGDYKKARFYLLKDTTNLVLLERQERNYANLSTDEKQEHRRASIRPVRITPINDSVCNYLFYSSYNQKDTTDLRIMKVEGEWLVDLKSIINK